VHFHAGGEDEGFAGTDVALHVNIPDEVAAAMGYNSPSSEQVRLNKQPYPPSGTTELSDTPAQSRTKCPFTLGFHALYVQTP
jgi:hypothetical protein